MDIYDKLDRPVSPMSDDEVWAHLRAQEAPTFDFEPAPWIDRMAEERAKEKLYRAPREPYAGNSGPDPYSGAAPYSGASPERRPKPDNGGGSGEDDDAEAEAKKKHARRYLDAIMGSLGEAQNPDLRLSPTPEYKPPRIMIVGQTR